MKIKPFRKIIEITNNLSIEMKYKYNDKNSKLINNITSNAKKRVKYYCDNCLFDDDNPRIEPCKSCIARNRHIIR